MEKIKVKAPATVANVGAGFDILGFALEQPYDELELSLVNGRGKAAFLSLEGYGKGKLPENEKNLCAIAVQKVMDKLNIPGKDIEIKLKKGLPVSSGLGSSSASIVGALYGANKLLGGKLGETELLQIGIDCEAVYSGAHADNVAPCLLGGFVLVRSYEPLEIIKLGGVNGLHVSVCHPDFELETKKARAVIPKDVPLKNVIKNQSLLTSLIYGIAKNDAALVARSANDYVVEPYRASLIPGFDDVKKAALNAGAGSCSISGAGPAVFAFTLSKKEAETVSKAMACAFSKNGLGSRRYVSGIAKQGVHAI